MSNQTSVETLDWLYSYWQKNPSELNWEPLFMIPPWLSCWTRNFSPSSQPSVVVVRNDGLITGVAPLLLNGSVASLTGSPNVCDYLDIICAPNQEQSFCEGLLQWMKYNQINSFQPGVVRPDSIVATTLKETALKAGFQVTNEADEVSFVTALPATFENYLQNLDAKQRHEVRRKARRLEEEGTINYRTITDTKDIHAFMNTFLKLFVESREGKARFLTTEMELFFRDLADTMSAQGLLRAGTLEIDNRVAASVLAFEHNYTAYLYNSGFDPSQSKLSVGILSKVYLIRDSISRGMKKFDFLKGDEKYKYHLGGKEVQLRKISIHF
jgi:CelD/BcsL family acetyltransferase involved in cellulose biosynthesis